VDRCLPEIQVRRNPSLPLGPRLASFSTFVVVSFSIFGRSLRRRFSRVQRSRTREQRRGRRRWRYLPLGSGGGMNIGAAAFREDRVPAHPHTLDQEMNGNPFCPRGKGSPVGRTYGLAAQRQSRRRPDCACGEGGQQKAWGTPDQVALACSNLCSCASHPDPWGKTLAQLEDSLGIEEGTGRMWGKGCDIGPVPRPCPFLSPRKWEDHRRGLWDGDNSRIRRRTA
jgi:hypothetical protein